MVKNLLSNTGDTGLIPSGGTKIPHAMWQLLSPCTTIRQEPHALQWKILCAATKAQQSQKNIYIHTYIYFKMHPDWKDSKPVSAHNMIQYTENPKESLKVLQ